VVRPPELARRVGTKAWSTFKLGDLEYRLVTSDNRRVMLVYNLGGSTVKLAGPDSVLVDTRGESRPVPGRTIVSCSYVKLIFPPPRPQVQSYGTSYAFGVGAGYGGYYGHHYHGGPGYGPYGPYGPYGMEPRYHTVYDPSDRRYFDWPANGEVRLILAYEPEGGEPFRHEFVIRRVRV
jgi:hypothetical protein